MSSLDELLCYYKFANVEMLGMLTKYSKCVMSLSTLKRYLKKLGLGRRLPRGSNLAYAFSSIFTYVYEVNEKNMHYGRHKIMHVH